MRELYPGRSVTGGGVWRSNHQLATAPTHVSSTGSHTPSPPAAGQSLHSSLFLWDMLRIFQSNSLDPFQQFYSCLSSGAVTASKFEQKTTTRTRVWLCLCREGKSAEKQWSSCDYTNSDLWPWDWPHKHAAEPRWEWTVNEKLSDISLVQWETQRPPPPHYFFPHTEQKSSCLKCSVSLHSNAAPPLARFPTVPKLPVRWICRAVTVTANPYATQNNNEERGRFQKTQLISGKMATHGSNEMPF